MTGRVLAVDPGDKRIGVAISDQTGTIARPLAVIMHTSRKQDVKQIQQLAAENEVKCIIVGKPFQESGEDSVQGRKAERLAEALRLEDSVSVLIWDESETTNQAQIIRREMGVSRAKRSGHLDSLAAAIILQDYLDSIEKGPEDENPN